MQTILKAVNIEGGYRDRKVIHSVSMNIQAGERVLLIGPNGCGKTTLLKILAGILPVRNGEVELLGYSVSDMPTHNRIHMGLGYLRQTRNTFPSLSVEENLHLGYWYGNGNFKSQRDWLLDVFPMLRDKLMCRAGLLSGGERQALAVGMVVMRPIKLLLMDEPTSGLSPKAAEDILSAIHRMQEALGFASVLVEHNLHIVHRWVSRILVMRQGHIVTKESDPKRVLNREWLQRYYFE